MDVVRIILIASFLLISISNFQLEATTRCTEINRYEDGFPGSVKYLDDYDLAGRSIIFGQMALRYFVNSIPGYSKSNALCHSQLSRMSEYVYVKWALRPRGCCAHCCLINKMEDHLSFYLFKNDSTVKILKLSSKKKRGTLAALGFNNESKTMIWMHGYTEDGYFGRSVSLVADAYLDHQKDHNVLTLDYSEISVIPWFLEAVDNIKLAAKAAAKFLIFYHKTGELRIDKIHLSGISMGGHMAAQLSKELAKFMKPARLTGLDPSLVIYREDDNLENFSKDDAEFVDIIHTSSGIIVRDLKPSGHADFYIDYPPGTAFRPACDLLTMADRGELPFYFICDHQRALRMFIQTTFKPYLFPVCKLVTDNLNSTKKICGYLGMAANKSTTIGEYHLTTPPGWNPWEGVNYERYISNKTTEGNLVT